MAKESAEEKKAAPGRAETVSLPALIRSGSSSPGRVRADAEHAVFRLQDDFDPRGDVVGDQGGEADAEVDVEAVAELAGYSADDALAAGGG
jgi:hypothetical protein